MPVADNTNPATVNMIHAINPMIAFAGLVTTLPRTQLINPACAVWVDMTKISTVRISGTTILNSFRLNIIVGDGLLRSVHKYQLRCDSCYIHVATHVLIDGFAVLIVVSVVATVVWSVLAVCISRAVMSSGIFSCDEIKVLILFSSAGTTGSAF